MRNKYVVEKTWIEIYEDSHGGPPRPDPHGFIERLVARALGPLDLLGRDMAHTVSDEAVQDLFRERVGPLVHGFLVPWSIRLRERGRRTHSELEFLTWPGRPSDRNVLFSIPRHLLTRDGVDAMDVGIILDS
jgi:hypothetical protein